MANRNSIAAVNAETQRLNAQAAAKRAEAEAEARRLEGETRFLETQSRLRREEKIEEAARGREKTGTTIAENIIGIGGGMYLGKKSVKGLQEKNAERIKAQRAEVKKLASDAKAALKAKDTIALKGIAREAGRIRGGSYGLGVTAVFAADAALGFYLKNQTSDEATRTVLDTTARGMVAAGISRSGMAWDAIRSSPVFHSPSDMAALEAAKIASKAKPTPVVPPIGPQPQTPKVAKPLPKPLPPGINLRSPAITVPLMKSHAEFHGIDLKGVTKRDDIIARLEAHRAGKPVPATLPPPVKVVEPSANQIAKPDATPGPVQNQTPKLDKPPVAKPARPALGELRDAARKAGVKGSSFMTRPRLEALHAEGKFQVPGWFKSGKLWKAGKFGLPLIAGATMLNAAMGASQAKAAEGESRFKAAVKGAAEGASATLDKETAGFATATVLGYAGGKMLERAGYKVAGRIAAGLVPGAGTALTIGMLGKTVYDEVSQDIRSGNLEKRRAAERMANFKAGKGYRLMDVEDPLQGRIPGTGESRSFTRDMLAQRRLIREKRAAQEAQAEAHAHKSFTWVRGYWSVDSSTGKRVWHQPHRRELHP